MEVFSVREEFEERSDANGKGARCKVASKQMAGFGH
jgi:hypothetical protein